MKLRYSLLNVILIVGLIGCDSHQHSDAHTATQEAGSESHDHGHAETGHPESFGEAVETIQQTGAKITQSFADGEPDKVHGELHEIGHLIELLPELAKKAGRSDGEVDTVQQAADGLMDAFGKLDDTLHGGDAVDVDEVSKAISTQIEKLQSMH